MCSFIVISLGCLSSFAHFFRFFSSSTPPPSQLFVLSSSAPPPLLLPSRPPPGDHERRTPRSTLVVPQDERRTGRSAFVVAWRGPGWVRLPPNTHVSIIRAHSATQPLRHRVTPSRARSLTHSVNQSPSHSLLTHSLTHFAPAIIQASEGGGEAGSVGVGV